MSGNGAVWGRVRGRLRAFPERLAACRAEAAAYGRCVQASTAPGGRLTKDLCVQEFEALRSCFAAAHLCGAAGGRRGVGLQTSFVPGSPVPGPVFQQLCLSVFCQDDPKGRPLGWTSLHYICVCCPQP
ncbi:NADH dehydrogenase [ubiquinone] 1 alpha subcomplex assembly factor 8 isoform X1 [Prionailurus bengalensis]|uniref:NADH dehydrogenase [ubiquinone] 1 alpha subcomplex assembly factor 8 isoform X3 n=1 Tax=Felis catus TaxID=9685 RepID=UPI000C2FEB7F|nr:NADH dehydrogenase [ubiquinone] 1 alpha subcomplex assembly factor 8 isoform X3 [Felis catus]XP_040312585.1 NADH dehydrogenase [ubiquinone] 1 alpha subcomplex assembly factor 8 isoform X1 [Puma yagouaroundi]XP_043441290.1 NADH dehydrogenase [ubiquinone] 1 alpha subcomplex assembly factor 8 isoform X1 [Prionailurus bengalensis]